MQKQPSRVITYFLLLSLGLFSLVKDSGQNRGRLVLYYFCCFLTLRRPFEHQHVYEVGIAIDSYLALLAITASPAQTAALRHRHFRQDSRRRCWGRPWGSMLSHGHACSRINSSADWNWNAASSVMAQLIKEKKYNKNKKGGRSSGRCEAVRGMNSSQLVVVRPSTGWIFPVFIPLYAFFLSKKSGNFCAVPGRTW